MVRLRGAGWYAEGDLASFGTTTPRETTGIWNQEIFQGWIGDSESTSLSWNHFNEWPKNCFCRMES